MVGVDITTSFTGGTATIAVTGEVDIATAPQFHAAVAAAVDAHPRTVVDLTATTHFDSHGLRVLFMFAGELEVVVAENGLLPRVLELASLSQVLRVRAI